MDEPSTIPMDEAQSKAPPQYSASPVIWTAPQQPRYVVAQTGLPSNLHPHSFMLLSIFVSIFCGFFNILTLFCSIPAIILSFVSSYQSKKGLYYRGKAYGNSSAGLSVGALMFGMVTAFVGILVGLSIYGVAFIYCISGRCSQDFWGRHYRDV